MFKMKRIYVTDNKREQDRSALTALKQPVTLACLAATL